MTTLDSILSARRAREKQERSKPTLLNPVLSADKAKVIARMLIETMNVQEQDMSLEDCIVLTEIADYKDE